MRVVIAGSRSIEDKELVFGILDEILTGVDVTVVLSGMAIGVDKLGKRWAESKCIKVERHPANWKKYGPKIAGFIRNTHMAHICDLGVIIHDGKSKGTAHMMGELRRLNVPYTLRVVQKS